MPSDLFSYKVRVGLYCDVANRYKSIRQFSFYNVITWMSMIYFSRDRVGDAHGGILIYVSNT